MSVQQRLEQCLRQQFAPLHLELENESHRHGGGQRDPGKPRESHFRVVVVSSRFDGLGLARQHQQVYQALGDLMKEIHALALHTYTPEEWQRRGQVAPESPLCAKNPAPGAGH